MEYEFNCRRVIENMKMVNGITRSKDSKRVYISETIRKTMNIYDRNPKTNDLTLVKKVSTLSGCDNLEVADDGNIYLGCHPKGMTNSCFFFLFLFCLSLHKKKQKKKNKNKILILNSQNRINISISRSISRQISCTITYIEISR